MLGEDKGREERVQEIVGNQGKEDPNLEQGWSAGTVGRKDTSRKIVSFEM